MSALDYFCEAMFCIVDICTDSKVIATLLVSFQATLPQAVFVSSNVCTYCIPIDVIASQFCRGLYLCEANLCVAQYCTDFLSNHIIIGVIVESP